MLLDFSSMHWVTKKFNGHLIFYISPTGISTIKIHLLIQLIAFITSKDTSFIRVVSWNYTKD